MPTRPDQFPRIAAKKAESEEVRQLFEQLQIRAEGFAQMLDEFTESIGCNRERREGKPMKLDSRLKRTIRNFEKDAEQAEKDMERLTVNADDSALLTVALNGVRQSIEFDERMLSGWHPDDQPMASRLLKHQQETLKLIEDFIETSGFKGRLLPIWHDRTNSKPGQRGS